MKNKRLIGILAFLVVSIIVLMVFCILIAKNSGYPLPMDEWARDLAYSVRGNKGNFNYWFFRIITETGDTYFIIVVLVVMLIYTKLDRRWLMLILAILLEVCLNAVFKGIFQRERPFQEYWWMYESSTSFPSGHSTSSGCLYSFLFYFFLTSKEKKSIRYPLLGVCIFEMLIVPISRIDLGMHYLSDCIAGLALGFIVSSSCMLLCEVFGKYNILNNGIIKFKRKENVD